MNKLSDRKIAAAKLPPGKTEVTLSDGDGLYLRLRSAADGVVRQWIFVRKAGGKATKVGLGGYPTVGLGEAREKAGRLRAAPGALTRDAAEGAVRTVADLFELQERVRPPASGRRELWDRYVVATLGAARLQDLSRARVAALLDDVVKRGAAPGARSDFRRTAGAVFGLLRQLSNFGLSRGLLAIDPTAGMKRSDFGHQGVPRERVLAPPELQKLAALMRTTKRCGPRGREYVLPLMGPGHAAAVRFLLATAARVGELAAAREEHFDLSAGTWVIPADVAKNGRAHVVHLSPFAVAALEDMRRMPSGTGVAATLAKALNGRQKGEGDAAGDDSDNAANKHPANNDLALPGGKWTPHDLRRTAATLMQGEGVRPDVIELCLNHRPAGLVAVYQRSELLPERASAFNRLGDALGKLMS